MLERIQESNIKKGIRYFCFDLNTNSTLYYHNGYLHKILHLSVLQQYPELEATLNYIHNLTLSCCIEIENVIYRGDRFIGYTIKFYPNYKSLRRSQNRNFLKKREDCYQILKVVQMLNENNLSYNDFHLGNFLINDYNSLACDLDSIEIMQDNHFLAKQNKMAIVLCLAYLYRLSFPDVQVLLRSQECFFSENEMIYEFINNMDKNNLLDFQNILKIIPSDNIEKSRNRLKNNVKVLKQNPYFEKYYR